MDLKSRLRSSSTSSFAPETYLTSEFFTDVFSDVTTSTGCDVTVSRNYDDCDAAGETPTTPHGITYHATSLVGGNGSTFDIIDMTSPAPDAFCDAVTTEPPRCLDNGSDVTSSGIPSVELTQLSSVVMKHESTAVYDVGNGHQFVDDGVTRQQFPVGTYSDVVKRCHDDMTSSETPQMLLPSSEDVETYFSTVGRPRPTETYVTQRHYHSPSSHHHHHQQHHSYYHHPAHQQVYAERLSSSEVSFSSSSSSDVKQQFYPSLYNYSAHHHHPQHVVQMSQPLQQNFVTAANYQESALNGDTSLTGLMSIHVTTCETADTCRSTLVPMLMCYSPSTTSSSLPVESHGSSGSVSGSFSALLRSSPVTRHVDLGLSVHSGRYGTERGGDVDNGDVQRATDTTHAADVMETTSPHYFNVMQPSSCYSDDQMTAWSSSGIVTLMKSFAGTVAEYRGLSAYIAYCFLYVH